MCATLHGSIPYQRSLDNRYFIELSFKGTAYHGWQQQPNAPTVQLRINSALETLLHQPVITVGAGRTDTGVHAKFFVAHFDSDKLLLPEGTDFFLYQLNSILPEDIVVHKIYRVNPNAHARYSALSRTYEYTICLGKDPFLTDYSWHLPRKLDVSLMNKVAVKLKEFHDFTSFSKLHSDTKTNNCTIYESSWEVKENILIYKIRADRFLRNMVRAIVGTMVEVGQGKISEDKFIEIIEAKNRSKAGYSVPSQGLTLLNIEYPSDLK